MQKTGIEHIAAELDRVHQVLLDGRLDDLATASGELEALLAQIEPADAADLDLLRRKASRNAACLDAAARGVRAARRRLAEIRAIDAGLGTYDDKGRRDGLPVPATRLTQRF